ncbi:MAG TPA: pyridoxal-phosphate dependent enzyme, partial [Solirubrobacteraceae bacterium]
MIAVADVEAARARLRGVVYETPCAHSETLSALTGARCFVKLENLQMTGSFKERGAANLLLQLSPIERARGVVAASAGNHGMAVAFHATRLGIRSVIVMPEWAPLIKVGSARRHGAEVVLAGARYEDAYARAREIEAERGLTFVHPFDDERVIAGQGTLGLEIVEQCPQADAVIVPVGGGGLIAGVAVAARARKPAIRVIGVRAADLASIADGIAVRDRGTLTADVIAREVETVVTVTEEEIANAILLLLEIEKTVVEGAGATTLAALVNRPLGLAGRHVVLLLSGGNIDVTVISRIIERGLVKDGRLVRLAVVLLDRPGALAQLTALVAESRANILNIAHNRAFSGARIGESEVELTLETSGRTQIDELTGRLRDAGFEIRQEVRGAAETEVRGAA